MTAEPLLKIMTLVQPGDDMIVRCFQLLLLCLGTFTLEVAQSPLLLEQIYILKVKSLQSLLVLLSLKNLQKKCQQWSDIHPHDAQSPWLVVQIYIKKIKS